METAGRYQLTRRIGAGAFATVWLGHDPHLDVPVAVKVLADNWSGNTDIRERFLAEARLLRRISDPRIIRVHDIGETPDGRPYFVMDHADSGTAEDLMLRAARGEGDPELGLHIGHETALGVQALHVAGVVHRDIKPSNILLTSQPGELPSVRIADLGMAKQLAEASGLTMTAGTPAYMAPEQIYGSSGLDGRADVYAVAAMTYALLTGRPPFDVDAGISSVVNRDTQARPAPLARPLGLPTALDDVLAQALSHDPARRPRSAAEFARRLDGIDVDSVVTARASARARTKARRGDADSDVDSASEPWSVAAIAGLGVLAFVVFAAATWLSLRLLS